ncbi:MAG: hypothetical protein ACI93G_001587 [Hyphomonas sp.]|jgi:hypothetical protein
MWQGEDILQFGGKRGDVGAIERFPEQYREFIATQPGAETGSITYRLADTHRDVLQDRVTGIMPMDIIDLLEIVEIEKDQRER